jgi:hypothetical protein
MKKMSFFFLLFPFFLYGQERISLVGNIFDGVTFFPIEGANIYNFSSKKYSFSNKEGIFEIFVFKGDTLIFSKPVYKQEFLVITQEMIQNNQCNISLFYKAIVLKEVNVFTLPPTYEAFKKEFVNTNLSDFLKKFKGTSISEQERITYNSRSGGLLDLIPGKVGQAVTSPITFFYDTFSKKAKMNRLYKEMVEKQEEVDNLPLKYNRELVTSLTGLEGEDLLDFMTFCKFSYYDLVRWAPEYIVVQIRSRFGDYEFYKALEDN